MLLIRYIYKFDENYNYVLGGDSVLFDDDVALPDGYTDVQPSEGLYKAKYDPVGMTWVESASEEYIDDLQPVVKPSELEIVRQQQAELVFTLMMKGVI